MKKILLVGMLLLSWNLLMAQDDVVRDGSTCENAILFDWEEGHIQNANQTLWYAVVLDESYRDMEVVLYLNNMDTEATTTVIASVYAVCAPTAKPVKTDTATLNPSQFKTTTLSASNVNQALDWLGGYAYFKLTTEEGAIQFSSLARIPEPTALQENRENGFKVYPNKVAAGTALTVELPEAGNLRLFDLSGRMLQQWTCTGNIQTVVVEQAGTYLLQFHNGERSYQTLLMCE